MEEQRRHNRAVGKGLGNGLQQGNGIYLNPYKGKALKEILISVINKIDCVEQEGKE